MTDATIHNLPIKPGKLFLLRLEPKDRLADFLVKSDTYRVVFTMDEDGDVIRSEGQHILQGGQLEGFEDERSYVNDALEGEARRLMVAEYATWDGLTHVERLDMQIAWLQDLRKRTEDDFEIAVSLVLDPGSLRRWNYEALIDYLQVLQMYESEMDGLLTARSAL